MCFGEIDIVWIWFVEYQFDGIGIGINGIEQVFFVGQVVNFDGGMGYGQSRLKGRVVEFVILFVRLKDVL